jgi:hypothetical protein
MSAIETPNIGNNLLGQVIGRTQDGQPPAIDRFEDSLVSLANKIGTIRPLFHEVAGAARLDLDEFNGQRRTQVLKGIGGTAVIGINAAHLKSAATPLIFYIAHEVKPSIAGVVASGVASSVIHAAWYTGYSNTLRSMAANFKHAVSKFGEATSLDKLSPAGLEPKPEIPDDDTQTEARRKIERCKVRLKRSFVMHYTTTMTYILGAAIQGQSYEDQRRLCDETSVDGAVFAFFKGILLTGIVAVTSKFDPNLGEGLYRFADSLKGAATSTALPFAFMGVGKAIKTMRNRNNDDELAPEDGVGIESQIPAMILGPGDMQPVSS